MNKKVILIISLLVVILLAVGIVFFMPHDKEDTIVVDECTYGNATFDFPQIADSSFKRVSSGKEDNTYVDEYEYDDYKIKLISQTSENGAYLQQKTLKVFKNEEEVYVNDHVVVSVDNYYCVKNTKKYDDNIVYKTKDNIGGYPIVSDNRLHFIDMADDTFQIKLLISDDSLPVLWNVQYKNHKYIDLDDNEYKEVLIKTVAAG